MNRIIHNTHLKDTLALANSRRRSDAFILIGVKEAQGGKSEVVDIEILNYWPPDEPDNTTNDGPSRSSGLGHCT